MAGGQHPGRPPGHGIQILFEVLPLLAAGQIFQPSCQQGRIGRDVGLGQLAGQHGVLAPVGQATEAPDLAMRAAPVPGTVPVSPLHMAVHHQFQHQTGRRGFDDAVGAHYVVLQAGLQAAHQQAAVKGLGGQLPVPQDMVVKTRAHMHGVHVEAEGIRLGQIVRAGRFLLDELPEHLPAGRVGGLVGCVHHVSSRDLSGCTSEGRKPCCSWKARAKWLGLV